MFLTYIINVTLISFLLLFFFNFISKKFDLLDKPNKRKIHKYPTPYTGGVAIALVYLFIIYLTDYELNEFNKILSISFLISVVGLIDDKYNLSVGSKLVLQIFCIFILVNDNLILENLGNFEIIGTIILGSFAIPFTILSVVLLINSFNYIDGQDGLLSGLFLVSIYSLVLYLDADLYNEKEFLILISLPVLVFFFFNTRLFKLPKLFLGDSGSMMLGYLIAFICISLFEKSNLNSSLIIWILAFYVYEFLSTNILRIKSKKKIFDTGHDHIHFELSKIFKSKFYSTSIIITFSILLSFFGYNVQYFFGNLISLISFVAVFILYLIIRIKINKNLKRF